MNTNKRKPSLKILHTSDWHLGRALYGKKRYEEITAFFNWLHNLIQEKNIDVLLIAGDVFDTKSPPNQAQELYYRFLYQTSLSCCRHIVIIAGNHDSPSFLNAPKELLKTLNVHVVASVSENINDEVIILKNENNSAEAIVCAVPYLRDRDIRIVNPGESFEEKKLKLITGIQNHYNKVSRIAEEKQKDSPGVPIIAMGHLFTAGGKTIDGDGVRDLYVGSLAHINTAIFPSTFNYVALGHLHIPQKSGTDNQIHYSGSPIPMGFGEASHEKSVIKIEFEKKYPEIEKIPVPCFQSLCKVSGGLDEIISKINSLKLKHEKIWTEIDYTGAEIAGNLRQTLTDCVANSNVEILRIKNRRMIEHIINKSHKAESLDKLDAIEVFERCLNAHDILSEERSELLQAYKVVLTDLEIGTESYEENLKPGEIQ